MEEREYDVLVSASIYINATSEEEAVSRVEKLRRTDSIHINKIIDIKEAE